MIEENNEDLNSSSGSILPWPNTRKFSTEKEEEEENWQGGKVHLNDPWGNLITMDLGHTPIAPTETELNELSQRDLRRIISELREWTDKFRSSFRSLLHQREMDYATILSIYEQGLRRKKQLLPSETLRVTLVEAASQQGANLDLTTSLNDPKAFTLTAPSGRAIRLGRNGDGLRIYNDNHDCRVVQTLGEVVQLQAEGWYLPARLRVEYNDTGYACPLEPERITIEVAHQYTQDLAS